MKLMKYQLNFQSDTKLSKSLQSKHKNKILRSSILNVVFKVFDVLGNEIETLVNEEKPAGTYEITWYAEQLPSGVYFYQLKAGSFVETKKMLLLK